MPDIVVFTQQRGQERVWVAEADVERWLRFWHRHGSPACRWRDYREWGGFWPRTATETSVMFGDRARAQW